MTKPDVVALQLGKHVKDAQPSAVPIYIHHELMSPLSRPDAITFLSVHFAGAAEPAMYALERDIDFNPVAAIGKWQGILNDIAITHDGHGFSFCDGNGPTLSPPSRMGDDLMPALADYVARNASRNASRPSLA